MNEDNALNLKEPWRVKKIKIHQSSLELKLYRKNIDFSTVGKNYNCSVSRWVFKNYSRGEYKLLLYMKRFILETDTKWN